MQNLMQIGFKDGSLSEKALRLDLLFVEKGNFFAINKPIDVDFEVVGIDTSYSSIISELKANIQKKEFEILGLENPYAASLIARDVSGVALVACCKDSASNLKNVCGSYLIEFEFLLVCKKNAKVSEKSFQVDLPILTPYKKEKAVVTHNFGKKCSTSFSLLKDGDEYQLWSAKTNYLRRHQIRLHAFEAGLRILGDSLYSQTKPAKLSDMKKGYKKFDEEKPLYPSIALHLRKIKFDKKSGIDADIKAPLSKRFNTLLGKLDLAL